MSTSSLRFVQLSSQAPYLVRNFPFSSKCPCVDQYRLSQIVPSHSWYLTQSARSTSKPKHPLWRSATTRTSAATADSGRGLCEKGHARHEQSDPRQQVSSFQAIGGRDATLGSTPGPPLHKKLLGEPPANPLNQADVVAREGESHAGEALGKVHTAGFQGAQTRAARGWFRAQTTGPMTWQSLRETKQPSFLLL